MDAARVSNISFTLATDMKLANILCGINAHGSKHPCCWCKINNEYRVEEGLIPQQRTLGRIREMAQQFQSANKNSTGKKIRPQDFMNCVEQPLFNDLADKTEIIDLIPPPELHLMIGVTSKLLKGLKDRLIADNRSVKQIEMWLNEKQIWREKYRGGAMEGNKCRLLLRNALELAQTLPDQYKVFALAMQRFEWVVQSCFGKDLITVREMNFEQTIFEFHQTYARLQISMTPKVHAVVVHVPQWCHKHNKGLGVVSEQASESVHYDFKKKWEHYQIHEGNERYSDHLLRCVVAYNSLHI